MRKIFKLNVFKKYLKTMSVLGHWVSLLAPRKKSVKDGELDVLSVAATGVPAETFDELDKRALALGNQYRALGILVGLLGIGVLFCAIAPEGLQLNVHGEHLFGAIKIGLMVLMLVVVIYGRRSKWRLNWATARCEAEKLRYRVLSDAIDALSQGGKMSRKPLQDELHNILEGDYGQIEYNKGKAKQYQDIESFSEALIWLSFVLVATGAVGHFLFPMPQWIFLTAFFPAAVGTLHGVNGFIGISTLADEHAKMTEHLSQAFASLQKPEVFNDSGRLSELAKGTLDILNSRDAQWAGTIRKVEGLKVSA